MANAQMELRTTGAKVTLRSRVVDIVGYRELLVNLVRKELKVRYKNSVLGFMWSLVNPAITIAVYYVIFSLVFKNPIKPFVVFLMPGILAWNMFQTALSSGVGSVVGNAPLVKKVWFPREILPLASVGSAIVDFGLQSVVLIATLVIMRWHVGWTWMPLVPLSLICVVLFSTALGIWLSAVNVKYRDTQHFLGIALMVWFWGTPIIYSFRQVSDRLGQYHLGNLPLLNPFTIVALSFQRAFYNRASVSSGDPAKPIRILPQWGYGDYLGLLGLLAAVSLVLLVLASRKFRKLEGDFAEEL
ncbi:MAG: hypothetical protein NVSMB16_15030 [Acidimicrobiales bacterium]